MAFLKVLSCSLIIIASVVSSVDKFVPNPAVHPQINLFTDHYDIKFTLYPNGDIFYGEYNVSGYISDETQNIYVYTENLSITGVKIVNSAEIFKENGEIFIHRPNKITYDYKTYLTTISFPFNLSGVYTLNMKYTGLLGDDGAFRTFYINNYENQNNTVWLAATHYNISESRRLFPVLKDTSHARYKISIKHHTNYTALSNMPAMLAVNNIKADENNMIWTHFKTTPMMYSYLIMAAVIDLSYITAETNQNIRLWCRTNMLSSLEFAYSIANKITLFLDKQWPFTRKTPKINHVVIPKLLNGKEITFGFVLHREADIIYNNETDHEGRKIEIIRLIGFKVAHEWFCNIILPYVWEDNLWLREGFAMFFGIYAANMSFPHLGIQDFFVVQMQHELLHWYTEGIWPLNSAVNSSIEIPRYIKVIIMFRTLQTTLTEEVFWNGIETYLYNRTYQYKTSNDFWMAMQSIIRKSSLFKIKYDIETRMANWKQLKQYPVVKVERNYNASSLHISVEYINTNIWIPVSITTQTHLNKILHTLWLDTVHSPNDTLYINFENENDWILVNLQQSGCYRVNYDAENWNRLSKYLNSKFFENMHVLDRAKIIDDTFHFLMTGRLNLNTFLHISHYLGQDTDYIAWYPMFKNLEYMSGFFAFPESASIKREISTQLNILLRKISYPDYTIIFQESVHTKRLREEAAKWFCILSHNSCFSLTNYELKSYITDRKYSSYKIWTEWLFCNGLMTATVDTWMKVFNIYMNESDNNVLKFLACSKNFSIILQYMDLMTLGATLGKVITDFDHINSFHSIVARHANNIEILNFMLYNLERIKPRQMKVIPALTMIINHVYSKQRINMIKEYVNNEIHVSKCPTPFLFTYSYNDRTDFNKYCPFKYYNETHKKNIIMYLNRKLEVRWHQIKTQVYQYRHLIEDFGDIFNEYLAD